MKWIAVVGIVGLVVVLWAGVGTAKNQGEPGDTAALRREVIGLRSEVRILTKKLVVLDTKTKTRLDKLQTSLGDAASETGANYTGDGCLVGATADLFIATWSAIDQFTQQTAQRTLFGARPGFDDKGGCDKLDPSVPRQTIVPPNFATYNSLIEWIRP